jgi:enoyl-CoA hydratase
MPEQITVRKEGVIEIIEFHNPPMNFISNIMLEEFHAELTRLKNDDSVRVLVLTGGMEDSFITHYDVAELLKFAKLGDQTGGREAGSKFVAWMLKSMHKYSWFEGLIIKLLKTRSTAEQGIFYWARCLELLDTMPKPVIAAISGLCLGGGCEISLCCDFRFMADNEKYRIGLPETLVGIIPGGTGTHHRLPAIVGEANALEILLTGNMWTAEQALSMGLINKILPQDQLMPHVMELAERLGRGAPLTKAAIRKNVRQGARMSFSDSRWLDLLVTNSAMYSEDAKAGMAKYTETVSEYDHLDLDALLEKSDDLLDGREVEFKGK